MKKLILISVFILIGLMGCSQTVINIKGRVTMVADTVIVVPKVPEVPEIPEVPELVDTVEYINSLIGVGVNGHYIIRNGEMDWEESYFKELADANLRSWC